MAMYEKQIYDGIQKGNALDYCFKCNKPGSEIKTGELEYKNVFKIHINGLEYCLCMDHFFQLLDNSDYAIINKDSFLIIFFTIIYLNKYFIIIIK